MKFYKRNLWQFLNCWISCYYSGCWEACKAIAMMLHRVKIKINLKFLCCYSIVLRVAHKLNMEHVCKSNTDLIAIYSWRIFVPVEDSNYKRTPIHHPIPSLLWRILLPVRDSRHKRTPIDHPTSIFLWFILLSLWVGYRNKTPMGHPTPSSHGVSCSLL